MARAPAPLTGSLPLPACSIFPSTSCPHWKPPPPGRLQYMISSCDTQPLSATSSSMSTTAVKLGRRCGSWGTVTA